MAEDLVQEALKRYLDNDGSINNHEGYIKRTIHNLYVNKLRTDQRHRVYISMTINSEPATFFPCSSLETTGELDQLFSLMQNVLTPQECAVFIMKTSFEKEYDWIENIFGITYENCRQLLHRAKTKLRHHASAGIYRGGSTLYNVFIKASHSGDLQPLIEILKEDIAAINN